MAIDAPVVTGYYRYTDIWFEWASALPNPDDRAPLKAIFAHDALVHSDHPLHVDGIVGVQMYIGTFPTGEARLLFSSRQVDYIRYWLHVMGLTKEIIPLPYSDCLLTESNLRSVSPVVYRDGSALHDANKQIDKNNKRLKGSNPTLKHRRHIFERVRSFWSEKKGVWCSMDFEAWELDHTLITEFGWSLVGWKSGNVVETNGHIIIDEARKYTNSKYVPDNRNHYNFGESELVKKASFKKRIQTFIASLSEYGPVFLVFHDNSQDIKYLKSAAIEAPLDGLSHILPDMMPNEGIFVVDTSDLFGALLGEGSGERRSLEKTCRLLQINTEYLHNAGNDAHYTLLAMKEMAEGDPLDIQREQRWPNRTGTGGVQVQLKAWEEDSDYSDEEGILPAVDIDAAKGGMDEDL
ncbi:hypothetical protein BDQ12DRAFT_675007 [Crucibulum laeve]|uniref:Gfd2/YDR514C-like C-terminal domain-containing protein n=1 Tax=Crucibulum laeve TaxID=68775 RepID=A0A5C3ME00_9AGAR|nr:hypothetical protein BDQ12DRAFT_675007 [Crucibulum laeve]